MDENKFRRIYMSGFQKLAEFSSKFISPCGNVLMFHQVSDDRDSWLYLQFCMTKVDFRQMLDILTGTGTKFISINDIQKSIERKEKFCCMTFDDGFEDTYTTAYPLLKERNIPFTVFVTVDFIGKEHYMTRDQLKEISADHLCTIGSHTVTHPLIRNLSSGQKIYEYSKSKALLEDMTGKSVDYFAYPYGSYYACGFKGDADDLIKAGYKAAFSTLSKPINKASLKHMYFLPRRNIGGPDFNARLKKYGLLKLDKEDK